MRTKTEFHRLCSPPSPMLRPMGPNSICILEILEISKHPQTWVPHRPIKSESLEERPEYES